MDYYIGATAEIYEKYITKRTLEDKEPYDAIVIMDMFEIIKEVDTESYSNYAESVQIVWEKIRNYTAKIDKLQSMILSEYDDELKVVLSRDDINDMDFEIIELNNKIQDELLEYHEILNEIGELYEKFTEEYEDDDEIEEREETNRALILKPNNMENMGGDELIDGDITKKNIERVASLFSRIKFDNEEPVIKNLADSLNRELQMVYRQPFSPIVGNIDTAIRFNIASNSLFSYSKPQEMVDLFYELNIIKEKLYGFVTDLIEMELVKLKT